MSSVPDEIVSFLMPLAGLFFGGGPGAHEARSGTADRFACAHAFSPLNEPVIDVVAAPAAPVAGRLKPMPEGPTFWNVMLLGFSVTPLPFQLIVAVNGARSRRQQTVHVPAVVPWLETPPLPLAIAPRIVPPLDEHDTVLSLAVVVDGSVLAFVSGGAIFTLAVMAQCTVPCALPRATFLRRTPGRDQRPHLRAPTRRPKPPFQSYESFCPLPYIRHP